MLEIYDLKRNMQNLNESFQAPENIQKNLEKKINSLTK